MNTPKHILVANLLKDPKNSYSDVATKLNMTVNRVQQLEITAKRRGVWWV